MKKYDIEGNKFLQNGIIVEENTPEEIYDAVYEMYERINGTWEENEEDEIFQKKYLAMNEKYEINNRFFWGAVCNVGLEASF